MVGEWLICSERGNLSILYWHILVYIGKLLEIDDSDAKISFCEHAWTLSIGSICRGSPKRDEIRVDFVNILHVAPVPAETKRAKKFEKFVVENVIENVSVWKNKN